MTPFRAFTLLLIALLLPASIGRAGARFNQRITVSAGTPVNVATGTSTAPDTTDKRRAAKILIQPIHGATVGIVYVMSGIQIGVTPASTNASDLTAELAAATSTAPGATYSDYDFSPSGGGILLSSFWIDGGTTGTVVLVTYELAE